MKAADRKKRDRVIQRLYLKNVPQVEIGRRHGLNATRVHDILQRGGLLPPAKDYGVGTVRNSIWDHAEGDRLRRAIWKRQREGAKARLAEIMGISN